MKYSFSASADEDEIERRTFTEGIAWYIIEPVHWKSVYIVKQNFHPIYSEWHASFSFKVHATTLQCRDVYYGQVIISSHVDYITNSKMWNFIWLLEVGRRKLLGVGPQETLERKVSVLIHGYLRLISTIYSFW